MSNLLKRRIDAAQGKIPCDLILQDVEYLDVFSLEWRRGTISIIDGVIVGVEPGLKGTRTVDGRGKWLAPGFIDAHVHVESSLVTPANFQKSVLPRGTTTAICDPHELTNVLGPRALQYFLDESLKLSMDLRVMMSSCVPATHLETNGGGVVSAEQLLPYLAHPKALGLAEMMNVPGVLNGDPEILKKLEAFGHTLQDGHCPLLRGQGLSAYLAAGLSSCHESSQLEEAREKLIKGMSVWIREGSVAKDLETLIPLLNAATSVSIGFCTDDRNPLDIAEEGHIDFLIRSAIAQGCSPEVAYRSASWSVARHYGIKRVGAIAPGWKADLVLLDDMRSCQVSQVISNGSLLSDLTLDAPSGLSLENTIRAEIPEASAFEGPSGQVHVIGVRPGKIITDRSVESHSAPGVARLTVLERHGRGSKPSNGYVRGFGDRFQGAIASSIGHDSHNLIAVGSSTQDMRTALAALKESGGGICVCRDGAVIERLALPLGGLMSQAEPDEIKRSLQKLRQASQGLGCVLPEPFLQLAFLSLPVIPSLKLTDQGLVDVEQFKFINVQAS